MPPHLLVAAEAVGEHHRLRAGRPAEHHVVAFDDPHVPGTLPTRAPDLGADRTPQCLGNARSACGANSSVRADTESGGVVRMQVRIRTLRSGRRSSRLPPAVRMPYIDGVAWAQRRLRGPVPHRRSSPRHASPAHRRGGGGRSADPCPSATARVAVFIVVSGYCLMLPVVADGVCSCAAVADDSPNAGCAASDPATSPHWWPAPPSSWPFRRCVTDPERWWDHSLPAFSLGTIGAHLLLIHNWRREWRFGIDTPMWTVALEVQIYVVFVFALLPLWRRMSGHRPNIAGRRRRACSSPPDVVRSPAWRRCSRGCSVLFAVGMCAAEASNRSVGWMNGRLDLVVHRRRGRGRDHVRRPSRSSCRTSTCSSPP